MSEQDRNLEPEEGQEDVEAHQQMNKNTAKDDDVEGHVNKKALGKALGKDDDDVEAHVNKL